jgi:hypothetical protein
MARGAEGPLFRLYPGSAVKSVVKKSAAEIC